MNEGQNGIFSGLANSDASNQSNFGLQTNNPAGDQPNSSLPASNPASNQPNFVPQTPAGGGSSSGDIILGGKDSRKSHKWLIFLILGAVLITAIVATTISFVTKNIDKNQTASVANTSFNQFANFITTGNESGTFPADEYNSSTYYALERAILNNDRDYFSTANQLFDKFTSENSPEAGSVKEAVVNFYKTDWPMIYAYGKYHFCSEEDFLNYYLNNGATATKEFITAEHQAYAATKYESANTVAEAYLAYAEYLLDSMDILENAGCIADKNIDEACVATITATQDQINTTTEILTNKNAADQIMESMVRNFIQELWTFTEVVDNE